MRVSIKLILLAICIIVNLSGVQQLPAQVPVEGEVLKLTVEQGIEIGLQNSKSLHSSSMKVEAADAKESEVRTSRLPSLKFSGSYMRLSDVPPTVIGPIQISPTMSFGPFPLSPTILDNYNTKLTVQQPLFTGFKISNGIKAAEYMTRATEQDYAKDKSELIYNIKNAYWNLFKAQEFKKVIDENVDQVKAHLNDVKNLLSQGLATNNDQLRVQVQLSNAQLLQIDANNNVRLAMIALDNVMGVSLDTKIEIVSIPKEQVDSAGIQAISLDALVAKAGQNRPEMKAMEFRVKAGEAGVSAARGGWFPQIFLVGDYNYARPNQRIFPSVDQFKDTWDVGIVASWDLWNWGATAHQTTQAQAQLAQAQDGYGQLRDGITLEVTQNYLNVKQAMERIGVSAQAVQQAQENYRVTDEKFKAGIALNTDLLDAEVALLQAKTNYTQTLVDFELAQARLSKAVGE